MSDRGFFRKVLSAGVALGAITLGSAVIAPSAGASSSASAGKKVSGGVVTWAEPPSAYPNYIFPFMSSQYDTVNNISQFQYLLYRPLYMFGSPESTSALIDIPNAPAKAPIYSDGNTKATINMKNWVWSNGESVNADDVLFFMNMLHAEKANWYSYVPGYFPDNVTNVTVTSPTQITFTFNKPYNPNWLTYNEFSQITPFPKAWDITATGGAAASGGCSSGTYGAASTDAACATVYNYLSGQASNIAGYSANPLWAVVDGPYTIAAAKGGSFTTSGAATLVPNPSYSGPQKSTISALKELPYTTDDAEYDALLGGTLDVGFLPTQDITKNTSNAVVAGPNDPRLASSYYMSPWVLFGYNYAVLKFKSTGDGGAAGPIFSQLYFRQALQSLIDQPLMISKILHGYGVPTYGPVPVLPANSYVDATEQTNPYPYSPSKAKSLLTSHGWKVVPNGVDTCIKPGANSTECGAGVAMGAKLDFTFAYASGTLWQQQVVDVEQSAWNSIGIKTTVAPGTFDTVVSTYSPPCTSGTPCTLEMGWWGGGWEYSPDYLPTGELLFATNGGDNSGNYNSAKANALIAATDDTLTSLDAYENYLAKQVPVIWEPNADYQQTEIVDTLKGIAPQNPFANIFPEYWYFVKK